MRHHEAKQHIDIYSVVTLHLWYQLLRIFGFTGEHQMKTFISRSTIRCAISFLIISMSSGLALAGPHGSEFDLTLAPAAGGMEGVGIARPQDAVAMLFGNPATLTQLEGNTEFIIGATFASPRLKANGGPTDLFGGTAANGDFNPLAALTGNFKGSSSIDALAAPHAVVIQRISEKMVAGFGFTGISGLGSDWRNVNGMPNLIADLGLFGANMSLAYQVSDQFSIGGTFTLGIANLEVGLTDSTGNVHQFAIGGSLGVTYDTGGFVLGLAYKAPLEVEYKNVIETAPDQFSSFTLEQPQEIQFGIATGKSFSDTTVIELDFRYKNWDNADGYSSFWKDQYIYSLGAQHQMGNIYLRAGYTYNTEIAKDANDLGNSFGEVLFVKNPGFGTGTDPTQPPSIPVTSTFLQLAQATIADGHWQQSVSMGIGYDVPGMGIRLDMNATYAFDGETNLGPFQADGSLFTAGMGLTWNFK